MLSATTTSLYSPGEEYTSSTEGKEYVPLPSAGGVQAAANTCKCSDWEQCAKHGTRCYGRPQWMPCASLPTCKGHMGDSDEG
jgi:hypothetical protein